MGAAASLEEKDQISANRKIEEALLKDARNDKETVKLLLLERGEIKISKKHFQFPMLYHRWSPLALFLLVEGAGECGKSTTLKQMRILHSGGFSPTEAMEHRSIIRSNTLHSIQALVLAMNKLGVKYGNPDREADASAVLMAARDEENQDQSLCNVADAAKRLWSDPGIQSCYERSGEFQLHDSAKYFLDTLDRISVSSYKPTEQDVLRSRVKTNGVVEVEFIIKETKFRVFDVGGQRAERRKWIHCFDNVQSILFMTAISEYDQKMREDEHTNRMHDSLDLFDSICNSSWFRKTNMILFLNKKDLFEEKITRKPITIAFPDYSGPQTYADCTAFIEMKFVTKNANSQKTIYSHFTCATDTGQVRFVLDAVIDTILSQTMKSTGLL